MEIITEVVTWLVVGGAKLAQFKARTARLYPTQWDRLVYAMAGKVVLDHNQPVARW